MHRTFGLHSNLTRFAVGAAWALLCTLPALATEYVVDQHHPHTDDANPGSSAAPFKTIRKAASVAQAGDTILVLEGDYAETVKLANSGAEGNPIVFKGLPRQSVKMQGFDTTGCDYLRIEGFLIADTDVGVNINSNYVTVLDNRFEGVQSTPIDTPDLIGEKPFGARIAFNKIVKCGKGFVTGGTGWLLERNEVTRLFCYGKGDADYTRPFGRKHILRQNYLHGSTRAEIKGSHTDGFQVFDDNNLISRDILIEENVVNDFAQGLMMEVHHPEAGTIKNWTFRRNIMFQRGVDKGWAYAHFCGGCEGFFAYGNTLVGGSSIYCGAGNVKYEDNLLYASSYLYSKGVLNATSQKNLVYKPGEVVPIDALSNVPTDYSKNILNKDPLCEDLSKDNVRLKKGSPAIAAGVNGATIGALEYPNVYYVDPQHGGASDENFGYPGAPYKTAAKALSVAEGGETILLRGGVYRELVKPSKPDLTIRAAKDEKVVISGADEISGWKRQGQRDAWSAPLAAKPVKMLMDGKPFTEFKYDDAAKAVSVSGFDPRLHQMETIVRACAIDLSDAPGTKFEGIETADTLGQAVKGKPR